MGANYAKNGSLNEIESDQGRGCLYSPGGITAPGSGPGPGRGIKPLAQKSEEISGAPNVNSLLKNLETPLGLKKRSKSLDAGGGNHSPTILGTSGSRGSRVEWFRRRSRKKSVDGVEGGRRWSLKKGVESLEEEGVEEEPPMELTERQKELIKETWNILEASVSKVGVVMFMGLFETHPDVQEVFLPFRGLGSDELKKSKQLRSHALRVMGLVEKAVVRLEKPDVLIPLVAECGKNHCGYGVKMEQLDLVGPQFLNAIQPSLVDHWNTEIEEAWLLFMTSIVYVMKMAMRKELATAR